MKYLEVSKEEYLELKELYNKAVSENKEMFVFKKFDLVTGYAKYLLEYLSKEYEK